MKKFIVAAIAVFAVTILFDSSANAQGFHGYNNGYSFGTGVAQSHRGIGIRGVRGFGGGGFFGGGVVRRESQPFFAVNPPVYYSGIVRRPYGISPFPAPAGITPVEMQVPAPQPITISNPFFNKTLPASDAVETEVKDETKNKTTVVANPYFVDEVDSNVEFASLESFVEVVEEE